MASKIHVHICKARDRGSKSELGREGGVGRGDEMQNRLRKDGMQPNATKHTFHISTKVLTL